jgi:2-keto-4-pentenoate hydratase
MRPGHTRVQGRINEHGEAQRLLGTTEPGSALLLAPYVYESPARILIEPAHTPAVEGEFAFKLGRDLPPRAAPYASDE